MRCLLLTVVFAVSGSVSAQVVIGVRGGVNSAQVVGFERRTFAFADRPVERLGLAVGVYAEAPAGRYVAFRTELLYSQKGLSIRSFEQAGVGEQIRSFELVTTLRADYVEAPLLVRASVPVGPVRIGALAGPALAVNVRESVTRAARTDGRGVVPPDVFPDPDRLDSFRAFDVGGVLGAEVGSGPAALDLRYTFGALGVANESPRFPDDRVQSVRNGVLTVAASYRFLP